MKRQRQQDRKIADRKMRFIFLSSMFLSLFAGPAAECGGEGLPLRLDLERVEVIELNHLYYDDGDHWMDQVIFWEWRSVPVPGSTPLRFEERLHVRDWCGDINDPKISRDARGYSCVWLEWPDDEHLRRVRAPIFRETWSQGIDADAERLDARKLPHTARRGLFGIPSRNKDEEPWP